MDSEHKTYEIDYLLTPLLPEDKVSEEVSALRKIIEDAGGFIIGEEMPKMQKLSYPIKKLENAYFGWLKFSIKPEAVKDFKNYFDKNGNVVRTLIIEADKDNAAQFSGPRTARAAKEEAQEPKAEEKPAIKVEEIDQKIDQMLKESM